MSAWSIGDQCVTINGLKLDDDKGRRVLEIVSVRSDVASSARFAGIRPGESSSQPKPRECRVYNTEPNLDKLARADASGGTNMSNESSQRHT